MRAAGVPASGREIERFERRHGLQLPADYKAFLRMHNGGMPTPSLVRGQNGEVSSLARLLSIGGIDEAVELYCPIGCVERGLLPIAESGGGDLYFLDWRSGAIQYWDHEADMPELFEPADLPTIAQTFDDLLGRLFGEEEAVDEIEMLGAKGTPEQLEEFVVVNSVDRRGKNGVTLSMVAAANGNMKLLRRCVELGADLSGAVGAAAGCGELKVLEFLLDLGCDVNEVDPQGHTPLDRVLERDVYDYLLSKGARSGGV